jgi:hypothetical protein
MVNGSSSGMKKYVRDRPRLEPLFGRMTEQAATALTDELIEIDQLLEELAAYASGHVGVSYRYELSRLGLFVRTRDAEVSGGPTAASGDLWFELRFPEDDDGKPVSPPPWLVTAEALAQCESDCGQSPHAVISLLEQADTPSAAVKALRRLVGAMRSRLEATPPQGLSRVQHENF